MVRKEGRNVKLLIHPKTHIDQYLNFSSHLHQKLGVIITLLGRCNNMVSEPEDRAKEISQT